VTGMDLGTQQGCSVSTPLLRDGMGFGTPQAFRDSDTTPTPAISAVQHVTTAPCREQDEWKSPNTALLLVASTATLWRTQLTIAARGETVAADAATAVGRVVC